ncbi:Hypothetical predicted protein [Pelobates cultripes]|uniref:Uncharacterized protein n=1 Tax=Pelobates cultripes TaxID=61616 RepID=A0AAD1VPE8_PELCU|nr:Hypothetical predicted protein [Pelobates cultripes]
METRGGAAEYVLERLDVTFADFWAKLEALIEATPNESPLNPESHSIRLLKGKRVLGVILLHEAASIYTTTPPSRTANKARKRKKPQRQATLI